MNRQCELCGDWLPERLSYSMRVGRLVDNVGLRFLPGRVCQPCAARTAIVLPSETIRDMVLATTERAHASIHTQYIARQRGDCK